MLHGRRKKEMILNPGETGVKRLTGGEGMAFETKRSGGEVYC